MSEGVEPGRRSFNRWELALWIVGAVLLLSAVAVGVYAVKYLYGSVSDSEIDSPARVSMEIALQFAPSVLTVGLLSLVLAIFVRAIRSGALVRLAAQPAESQRIESDQVEPEQVMAEIVQPLPTATPSAGPIDHSLFMRPTTDGVAPRE